MEELLLSNTWVGSVSYRIVPSSALLTHILEFPEEGWNGARTLPKNWLLLNIRLTVPTNVPFLSKMGISESIAYNPSTAFMKWKPEYSLVLIVSFTCFCRFKFVPFTLSNDMGSTSRTVPLASIVMQSITAVSTIVRFDRTARAAGPSMPVSERTRLASARAVSILERLEFTASEAESSLHKGSPLVVCGPKLAPSDAYAVQVVPNIIFNQDHIYILI